MICVACDRCDVRQDFHSIDQFKLDQTWHSTYDKILCDTCWELLMDFMDSEVLYSSKQKAMLFIEVTELYWKWKDSLADIEQKETENED